MRSIAACAWLPLALACSFDASGVGEAASEVAVVTSSGSTSTGEPPGPTSTGAPDPTTDTGDVTTGLIDPTTGAVDPTTGTSTTTAPDPTTTTDTTTTTTTGDDTTTTGDDTSTGEPDQTTGPDPCETPTKLVLQASDATVTAPMAKYVSNQGEGMVVYSTVENQGTADFAATLACPGELAVWARVLDLKPGINGNDPDSLFIRVDGGEERTWFYGCQTEDLDAGYNWLRLYTGVQGETCDKAVLLTPNLAAGAHNLVFRNREPMNNEQHVAAIARVLVTSDLAYVPTDDD